jgi:hypothetical protein
VERKLTISRLSTQPRKRDEMVDSDFLTNDELIGKRPDAASPKETLHEAAKGVLAEMDKVNKASVTEADLDRWYERLEDAIEAAAPKEETRPRQKTGSCDRCGGGGYLTITSPRCPDCNQGTEQPQPDRRLAKAARYLLVHADDAGIDEDARENLRRILAVVDAPPKEVLQGIEEAVRGEGRYLNDDELEVMPNAHADDNVALAAGHLDGAPSEPLPLDAAPVAPSDEAKLAFIKAHTAVMPEWEVTNRREKALDAGLRAYDAVNAHPRLTIEDAPGGPYQMDAVDDIPPELKEKIGRAVAEEVARQAALGVVDHFKLWRAGLAPCREKLNQLANGEKNA